MWRKWLQDALDRGLGTHTLSDVTAAIDRQEMQLWLTDDCAMVTEIVKYPRKRVLNLFLAGGSLEGMRAIEPRLETFARKNGCDTVTIQGRKGWAVMGWDEKYRVFAREIEQ